MKFKKIIHYIIDIIKNIFSKKDVIYIIENSNWSIGWDGHYITRALKSFLKSDYRVTSKFLENTIIHFGSIHTFLKQDSFVSISRSNNIVVTWFHVVAEDPRLKKVPELNKKIDLLHVSCNITKKMLVKYGMQEDKIIVIPLGVDTKMFISSKIKQNILRKKLDISSDVIVVGSFQKDGIGWKEGSIPKLEKGPDVFCDTIEQLAKRYPIHVLLTGPARGYVKKRLSSLGIRYTHRYLKNYIDIVDYYNILDLYLITSRYEGGPKGLLEAWACEIPVISTQVGMVQDIADHKKTCWIAGIEDVDSLVKGMEWLLDNDIKRKNIVKNAKKQVQLYDWEQIGFLYYKKIYEKIITKK
ncbi:MAG: glycosyltransferase family 4 protein [Candidatus Magasanikbacteria bacterium]|nr:glycosyltransferase family 4 protein [Candidatus Magasanikbacteria bacterium]MBT4071547.1 glycosyltransferase family 4 protein [Candidatus Magasanikbacteria bacterium]